VPSAREPEIGRPLPNAHLASVPRAKLYDYALNPAHARGGAKARLWVAVFGIEREDWRYARTQLLLGLRAASVSEVRRGSFGTTYGVAVTIRGRNGRIGPVMTAWKIVNHIPRVVTAFPRV
jgi:filamentous hemagglutinin